VHGPSRAVIEDLVVDGNGTADGMVFDTADQPTGRVHAEALNVTSSQTGVAASGMRQSSIDLESFNAASNTGGIQLGDGSRLRIFGASASNNRTMYSVGDGSSLTATDVWEEGGTTQHVGANGSGVLTLDGGRLAAANGSNMDLSTFTGSTTVINQLATNAIKSGSDSLALGLVAPQGVWSAGQPRWALWADKVFQGGGSKLNSEAASGVYDASSFLRQHLAALRDMRPAASPGLVAGVSDVQLYRLDVTRSRNGVTFSGTGGMVGT
jgi:hypothetical protein